LGDFQTIQHTDKHIVIFNQNASHRASLFKNAARRIFVGNGCIFYDGARRTKLSIYKVLLSPVIFAFAISSKKSTFSQ